MSDSIAVTSTTKTGSSVTGSSINPGSDNSPLRLGFLGVGTMNAAIIRGIAKIENSIETSTNDFEQSLLLSPRGKDQVETLLADYGEEKIKIASNNQEVLDGSDIIFVGLRAEHIEGVFGELVWREEHRIVNLTTVGNEKMSNMATIVENFVENDAMADNVLNNRSNKRTKSVSEEDSTSTKKLRIETETAEDTSPTKCTETISPTNNTSTSSEYSSQPSSAQQHLPISNFLRVVPLPAVSQHAGVAYMSAQKHLPISNFLRVVPLPAVSQHAGVAYVSAQKHLPISNFLRVVPLPAVSQHAGVAYMTPKSALTGSALTGSALTESALTEPSLKGQSVKTKNPFSIVFHIFNDYLCKAENGGCVAVVEENEAPVYHSFLGLMGPLYQHLNHAQKWGIEKLDSLDEGHALRKEESLRKDVSLRKDALEELNQKCSAGFSPGISNEREDERSTSNENATGIENATRNEAATRKFLVSTMNAVLRDCLSEQGTFQHHMETQTPGGLNEMAMKMRADWEEKSTKDVLNAAYRRVGGK